ncbi:glycerophosphodiester phosphodiesterase [Aquimarina sp. 2201CG5-10]|uniref:glycerophosphodiester phosphodiesterase n=1 Tax=Aquimarina callyspongiae TaxID=3098150 RepID=UPI002AB55147|nr:glycerophosphodiester phosphodiesterase family protein [Aquimarina sp. 2201CG5-10]MDY8134794.1 glycerophosphodiester phosphodiesterase family protein [Aquimarina sp. 2201CG5-10]
MKIFGHRGAAGLIEENTLESIAEALKYNVDGIEIDVHRCKSGELVVIHDETIERTTNGKGKVADYTWSELKRFRTFAGFKIPSLDQVLELVDAKCILNIELKGIGTALPTIELLERHIKNTNWDYDHFILSSFDHSQLFQIKAVTQKFRLGVLIEESIPSAISIAEEINAFSIHPPVSHLSKNEVELAKTKEYKIFVWTVNEETAIEKSKDCKVDAIITDFPNFA